MTDATQAMQPPTAQPFAAWNPTRGIWETGLLNVSVTPDLWCREVLREGCHHAQALSARVS